MCMYRLPEEGKQKKVVVFVVVLLRCLTTKSGMANNGGSFNGSTAKVHAGSPKLVCVCVFVLSGCLRRWGESGMWLIVIYIIAIYVL